MEEPGSTGVEEFSTDCTDGVEKMIEERIDRMLALRGGSVDEADGDAQARRRLRGVAGSRRFGGVLGAARRLRVEARRRLVGPCVGLASRAVLNVSVKINITVCVASLDHVSVSLRGRC